MAIVGEPGVGKSRLVWEIMQTHRGHGWLTLHMSAVSYGQATPYWPVIQLLKTYFQIEDRDDPAQIREKLKGRILALDPALMSSLDALLTLLDLPAEDGSWTDHDPAQLRQRTLDALKGLWLREAQVRPVLDLACAHGERGSEAWVWRLLGRIASHRDPPDIVTAEGHYRQALALADKLGARPLAAHCHLSLGELYHRMGDRAKADEYLTIARTMYREMDLSFWLAQVEGVLRPPHGNSP